MRTRLASLEGMAIRRPLVRARFALRVLGPSSRVRRHAPVSAHRSAQLHAPSTRHVPINYNIFGASETRRRLAVRPPPAPRQLRRPPPPAATAPPATHPTRTPARRHDPPPAAAGVGAGAGRGRRRATAGGGR
jgi:hypothetical protein